MDDKKQMILSCQSVKSETERRVSSECSDLLIESVAVFDDTLTDTGESQSAVLLPMETTRCSTKYVSDSHDTTALLHHPPTHLPPPAPLSVENSPSSFAGPVNDITFYDMMIIERPFSNEPEARTFLYSS